VVGLSDKLHNGGATTTGNAYVYNCTSKPAGYSVYLEISEPTNEVPSAWTLCATLAPGAVAMWEAQRASDRSQRATQWRTCSDGSWNAPTTPVPAAAGFSCTNRSGMFWTSRADGVELFNCSPSTEFVEFRYTEHDPMAGTTQIRSSGCDAVQAGTAESFDNVRFLAQEKDATAWRYC
jgi:hypothetical protein